VLMFPNPSSSVCLQQSTTYNITSGPSMGISKSVQLPKLGIPITRIVQQNGQDPKSGQ